MTDESPSGPYAQSARMYWEAGHRGVIPIGFPTRETSGGPRQKSAPPGGYTGWAGRDVSYPDFQTWADDRKTGAYNVGLRIPRGVYVPDFDIEGRKEQIEELAGEKFPKTWTSTSWGPGGIRHQAFYRADLPAGRMWKDHPVAGMDSLHFGHRYAMVWPSIHPRTGNTVAWYDPDGELYEGAPRAEWWTRQPDGLGLAQSREGTPLDGSAATPEEVIAAFASFRRGVPCRRVDAMLNREIERMRRAESEGSIRDPGQLLALIWYGMEGHAGVAEAAIVHQEIYVETRVRLRGERADVASGDWLRQAQGAIGKKTRERESCECDGPAATVINGVTSQLFGNPSPVVVADAPVDVPGTDLAIRPLNLPEGFWEARPALKHIRSAAHSLCTSADLVLYCVLTRLAAMSHHELGFANVLTPQGGASSLNLFTAVVGQSGAGKSSGVNGAEGLLPRPSWLQEWNFKDGVALGTGEGLAESFMGTVQIETVGEDGKTKKSKVRKQTTHNTLFYVDEGQSLTQQAQRQGATIGPALRQAWPGSTLGQQNAVAETTRIIMKGTYSLGLIIGYQMNTALALMSDVQAGTPQRFIWCSATDPSIPGEPCPHPGALPFAKHPLTEEEGSGDIFMMAGEAYGGPQPRKGEITFPQSVNDWLWSQRLARSRGEVQDVDLDSHMMLMLCKLAALLALLDERMAVSEEDWELANQLWRTSCAVRDAVVKLGRETERDARRVAEEHRLGQRVAEAAAVRAIPGDVARVREWAVRKLAEKGPMTESALRKLAFQPDRVFVKEAVGEAVEAGRIERDRGLVRALSGE